MARVVIPPVQIQSVSYYGRAESGGSRALLIGYSDGAKRATKVMGNPQGNIVLVNELVVARLAELIGVPCPKGSIVLVDQAIIDAAKEEIPELSSATAGLSFGSEWMEAQYGPGIETCRSARNRSSLGALVVLYTWVRNGDLKGSHLLWKTLEDGAIEVFGFDHGHCFGNPTWDTSLRRQISNLQLRSIPQLTEVVTGTDIEPYVTRVLSLHRQDIDTAVGNIPNQWGVPPDALASLADYLEHSRPALASVVTQAFQA